MGTCAAPLIPGTISRPPADLADTLPDLTTVLALRPALGIVHHLPGRLRLRLGPALLERVAASGLSLPAIEGRIGQLAGLLPGLRGWRLNPAAASLLIEYDPARLQPQWWETLVLGEDDEALALALGFWAGMPTAPDRSFNDENGMGFGVQPRQS